MFRIALGLILCLYVSVARAGAPGEVALVHLGPDGRLVYEPDPAGNLVPDYSNAGYEGGGVKLPEVPVRVTLHAEENSTDDSPRIQTAIDEVSKLPLDAHGFRGAVMLEKGVYNLKEPLRINASGVVLRGAQPSAASRATVTSDPQTLLRAVMRQKCKLITISGSGTRKREETRREIVGECIPVGAKTFTISSIDGLKIGDRVLVVHNTNAKWVHELGMDQIPPRPKHDQRTVQWEPGPREFYDRTIVAIDGNRITLDAPIFTDITKAYGGGWVQKYSFDDRISQCGIENIAAQSIWVKGNGVEHDGKQVGVDDLRHSDVFIQIDKAENIWVRGCSCKDFLQGGYWMQKDSRGVTVEDCSYEVPNVSLGYYIDEPHDQTSRYSFLAQGTQILVQRCFGKCGRHTFMTGSESPGPIVFLDCNTAEQHGLSETHHRWATGVLYDCVGRKSATSIEIVNRSWMGTGHGWGGAYCMLWNCIGNPIICEIPPTASNWCVGCSGSQKAGPFNPLEPQAYLSWGHAVQPMSLYREQLRERLGEEAVRNAESR